MAISSCAVLLPTLSIMSAAFRHNRRFISMSVRASAMRCSQIEYSMIFLPKAVRDEQPLHHLLQRLLGLADGAHAVMDAAGAETALRDLEAAALAEQDVARRERARSPAAPRRGRAAHRRSRTPAASSRP